jgi:hypothetical protein
MDIWLSYFDALGASVHLVTSHVQILRFVAGCLHRRSIKLFTEAPSVLNQKYRSAIQTCQSCIVETAVC